MWTEVAVQGQKVVCWKPEKLEISRLAPFQNDSLKEVQVFPLLPGAEYIENSG